MALWTRPDVEDNHDDDFFGKDGESDDDGCDDGELLDERLVHRLGDGSSRDNHGNTRRRTTSKMGLAEHEAAAVQSQYQTLGYHETYESSQEATLQEGFVAGYTENFDTAFQIGVWLGRAAAVAHGAPAKEFSSETDTTENQDGFRKAVARIKTVVSETATQESASSIVVPPTQEGDTAHEDEDEDESCEISAKLRADPLKDLQLELEELYPNN